MDRLYLAHHLCGGTAYLLALAHTLAAASPAALSGQWQSAAYLLNPIASQGPMRWGWAALLLLMAMLLVTFWIPLRYRRWRQVHWVVAPAFAFGALHAWPLSTLPAAHPLLGAACLVVIACVAYQIALRRTHWQTKPYQVKGSQALRPDLAAIDLVPTQDPMPWRPGQFVFARFEQGPAWLGCKEWHPYTIAGPADCTEPGSMRLLIRAQGPCSQHVQIVPKGTQVSLRGPHGGFMQKPLAAGQAQVWIAGGIGITPFLAQLMEPCAPGQTPTWAANPVDLVFVRRPDDASLAELLGGSLSLPPGTRTHDLSSNDRDASRLWQLVSEKVGSWASRELFLCGPPALVDALREEAMLAGVPAAQIHSERFDFR